MFIQKKGVEKKYPNVSEPYRVPLETPASLCAVVTSVVLYNGLEYVEKKWLKS